jgi:hypothetical protein
MQASLLAEAQHACTPCAARTFMWCTSVGSSSPHSPRINHRKKVKTTAEPRSPGGAGSGKGQEGVELQAREGPAGQVPRPPLHPLPSRPSFSDRLPTRPSELLKVSACSVHGVGCSDACKPA